MMNEGFEPEERPEKVKPQEYHDAVNQIATTKMSRKNPGVRFRVIRCGRITKRGAQKIHLQ